MIQCLDFRIIRCLTKVIALQWICHGRIHEQRSSTDPEPGHKPGMDGYEQNLLVT